MTASAGTHEKLDQVIRAKYKQDNLVPHLIHITDGRLIPNTIAARGDPNAAGGLAVTRDANYVPYHGPAGVDTKARLKWLATANIGPRMRLMNSAADDTPPVDIGKMSKDQMVSFALAEFGLRLTSTTDIRAMRKAIEAAAGTPLPSGAPVADEALG